MRDSCSLMLALYAATFSLSCARRNRDVRTGRDAAVLAGRGGGGRGVDQCVWRGVEMVIDADAPASSRAAWAPNPGTLCGAGGTSCTSRLRVLRRISGRARRRAKQGRDSRGR